MSKTPAKRTAPTVASLQRRISALERELAKYKKGRATHPPEVEAGMLFRDETDGDVLMATYSEGVLCLTVIQSAVASHLGCLNDNNSLFAKRPEDFTYLGRSEALMTINIPADDT